MKRPFTGMRRPLLALGLAGLTAGVIAAEPASDALARAQAAAAAGQSDAAVALYDEHLQAHPNDIAALTASAQLLSWQSRFDQAIARYERALALDPQNRMAQLERAKVLSWARRYRESIDAFRALLAQEPDNIQARIGLARTLSWSGELSEAQSEYEKVLSREPRHPEALLGMAQVYAWSGQLGRAREAYRVAAVEGGNEKDAAIGLAYIDLWQGAAGTARRSAEALHVSHPGDADVAGLLDATRSATSIWTEAGWDELNDEDDNRLSAARFQAGTWLGDQMIGRLGYTHYDIGNRNRSGTIDSLQLRAEWLPALRHRVELSAGLDRLESDDGAAREVADWGLSYRFPLGAQMRGWLSATREPFRYSVALLDNRIVIDGYSGGLQVDLGRGGTLGGSATIWDLNDGNRREAYEINTQHPWRLGRHTLAGGLMARWMSWDQDLQNGYFDPDTFRAYGLSASASGPLGHERLSYSLSLEAGLQSYETGTGRTTDDPYHVVVGLVGWQLARNTRLEVFAESGSYASQGAQEWRYDRYGVRISWRPAGTR